MPDFFADEKCVRAALSAEGADVRAVATDAMIEGVIGGRARPHKLSPPLIDLLQYPRLKLNRRGEALADMAR